MNINWENFMKTVKENVRHMYYTNVYKKIESTGALQLIIRWTYRGTEFAWTVKDPLKVLCVKFDLIYDIYIGKNLYCPQMH